MSAATGFKLQKYEEYDELKKNGIWVNGTVAVIKINRMEI